MEKMKAVAAIDDDEEQDGSSPPFSVSPTSFKWVLFVFAFPQSLGTRRWVRPDGRSLPCKQVLLTRLRTEENPGKTGEQQTKKFSARELITNLRQYLWGCTVSTLTDSK